MALPKFLQEARRPDKLEGWLRAKFPRFEDVELRLKHCWSPDRVLTWHQSRFPGEQPRVLRRFKESAAEPPTVSISSRYSAVAAATVAGGSRSSRARRSASGARPGHRRVRHRRGSVAARSVGAFLPARRE